MADEQSGFSQNVQSDEGAVKSSSFQIVCLTLFPELFPGPLGTSVTGAALEKGLINLDVLNLRDFAEDKHRSVDDTPAGGGPGMVLRADVTARAIDAGLELCPNARRIYLSPRGKPLTQNLARELSEEEGLLLLCGRFEGLDERVIEARSLEEISVGDFVMTGGEMAAFCLADAVVRLRDGVVGDASSLMNESFDNGLLEYPQYTRPRDFEGRFIPDVLLEGNHEKIREWRRAQSVELTIARRPDLLEN